MAQPNGSQGQTKPGGLPTLLCLHGEGESKELFAILTARIRHLLRQDYRLVFVNAPLESSKGPTILPAFERPGSYWRWAQSALEDDSSTSTAEESAREDELRCSALEPVLKQPIAGILAFAQGTQVLTSLLSIQQRQKNGDAPAGCPSLDFRFAIVICGKYPSLTLDRWPSNPSETTSVYSGNKAPMITIPSMHLLGMEDPGLEDSRKLLAEYYDEKSATVFEVENGHKIPTLTEDLVRVKHWMMKAHKK